MSTEEQDAVIGRVARERKQAEMKLAALRSEADRLGQILSAIGTGLRENPEMVFFEGQSVPAELALTQVVIKRTDVDTTRLITLTDDIRITLSALENLRRQAQSLGL